MGRMGWIGIHAAGGGRLHFLLAKSARLNLTSEIRNSRIYYLS